MAGGIVAGGVGGMVAGGIVGGMVAGGGRPSPAGGGAGGTGRFKRNGETSLADSSLIEYFSTW